MNTNDTQLIAEYLAGADVSEALLEACKERPDIRQELADHVAIDRLIALVVNGDEGEGAFSKENLERRQSSADDVFVKRVLEQLRKS